MTGSYNRSRPYRTPADRDRLMDELDPAPFAKDLVGNLHVPADWPRKWPVVWTGRCGTAS